MYVCVSHYRYVCMCVMPIKFNNNEVVATDKKQISGFKLVCYSY